MKKSIWLTLVFLFLSTTVSYAHTGLKNSTPAEGEFVIEELQEIVLEFNTGLENASSFTVKDAEGMEIPLGVSVDNDKMIGTLGAAMADGKYAVNWNIIGSDGHSIEGTYAFTMNTGEETTPTEVPEVSEEPADTVQEVQAEPAGPPYVLIFVLVTLMVVAGGTLIWAAKRRSN